MDPKKNQSPQGIVDATSKYVDAQNKLNAQVDAIKKQKEEEEYTAKIMNAMDQIQK